MNPKQRKLLREIMEISFCLLDISLYLNTHPGDERALRLHNTLVMQNKELENQYITQYGPLRLTDLSSFPYSYIESPWPWEIDFAGCI